MLRIYPDEQHRGLSIQRNILQHMTERPTLLGLKEPLPLFRKCFSQDVCYGRGAPCFVSEGGRSRELCCIVIRNLVGKEICHPMRNYMALFSAYNEQHCNTRMEDRRIGVKEPDQSEIMSAKNKVQYLHP